MKIQILSLSLSAFALSSLAAAQGPVRFPNSPMVPMFVTATGSMSTFVKVPTNLSNFQTCPISESDLITTNLTLNVGGAFQCQDLVSTIVSNPFCSLTGVAEVSPVGSDALSYTVSGTTSSIDVDILSDNFLSAETAASGEGLGTDTSKAEFTADPVQIEVPFGITTNGTQVTVGLGGATLSHTSPLTASSNVSWAIYRDDNGNFMRDANEMPIAGTIGGLSVVATNTQTTMTGQTNLLRRGLFFLVVDFDTTAQANSLASCQGPTFDDEAGNSTVAASITMDFL